MADTVFAKIIRGEIPCHKVYEDSRVFAFLDINPLSPGHMLVVPKEAAETLDQLSDESAAAIGRVLPRLCRAVVAATGTRLVPVLVRGSPRATDCSVFSTWNSAPPTNCSVNDALRFTPLLDCSKLDASRPAPPTDCSVLDAWPSVPVYGLLRTLTLCALC
jgi:hypothetical protein